MQVCLIDPFPLRRAAYSAVFTPWAKSNGFDINEAAPADDTDSTLVLVVLAGDHISSANGRALLDKLARETLGRICVIVDSHTPECVDVALENDVKGVLVTSEEPSVVFAALDFIAAGGCYIPHVSIAPCSSPEISYIPKKCESTVVEDAQKFDLTHRQHEVLRNLQDGSSNKEIARKLNVSEATVKSHVSQVMRKLNASNRTQAALLSRDQ
jgi:DNA-binding NarL/FixJ family response regulator